MPVIDPASVNNAQFRWNRRRSSAERRTLNRSRWWYPVAFLVALAAICYSALRADQRFAELIIWPTEGSQFVEVGNSAADPDYRDTMAIVAGGLNRKSGNLVADALVPSISSADTRVFSLVYGSGIYDDDIDNKFDALFRQYRPNRIVLVGSSMGGDVVLNIAAHFQQTLSDPTLYPAGEIVPAIDTIYLDCTPMGLADIRYGARAQADFLTGLTENVGTDGGAVTRLVAELLAQRKQWSSGNYPFITVHPHDFAYKWSEVWREKLNRTGVSTALVKDQYGVIRRFNADRALGSLSPGAHLVFIRPDVGENDQTIDVQKVGDRLKVLAAAYDLDLTVIDIPGGSHASAIRDAATYNRLISAYDQRSALQRIDQRIR